MAALEADRAAAGRVALERQLVVRQQLVRAARGAAARGRAAAGPASSWSGSSWSGSWSGLVVRQQLERQLLVGQQLVDGRAGTSRSAARPARDTRRSPYTPVMTREPSAIVPGRSGSGSPGPIGCGKSTVAGWLGERPGVVVIDADVVAREVLEPRRAGARRGRRAVRRRISCAPMGRWTARRSVGSCSRIRRLCATWRRSSIPAVRPRILAAIAAAEADGAEAVVIEAIQLVEGGLADAVRRGLAGHLRPGGPAGATHRSRFRGR